MGLFSWTWGRGGGEVGRVGGGRKCGSLKDLSLSMLTGTLVALDADGHDSPGCAPAALCSPGSGPVPQLTAACSPLPARCEAGSEAAGSSRARMNTCPAWLASLGCPRLPPTLCLTSHCVVSRQALRSNCWLDSRSCWLWISSCARSSSSLARRLRSSPRSPWSSPRSRDTSVSKI